MSRVVTVAPEPVLPTPRSHITPAVRYRVMDRQKGLCAACGEPLAPGFHVSEDAGGNLQAVCGAPA